MWCLFRGAGCVQQIAEPSLRLISAPPSSPPFGSCFIRLNVVGATAGVSLRSATLAPLPTDVAAAAVGGHALYILLRASMLLPPPRGSERPTRVGRSRPAALWQDAPQVTLVLRVEGG